MKDVENRQETLTVMGGPVHNTVSDRGLAVPKYGVQLKVDNDLFFYEVPLYLIEKIQSIIFRALNQYQRATLKKAMSGD